MSPQTLEVYNLGVVGDCAKFVHDMITMHPDIVFTSGRRTRESHAWAMAQNVVIAGRKWIQKTYKSSTVSKALQKWVDKHPLAVDAQALSVGFLDILNGYTDEELAALSYHFSGRAVDIEPVDGGYGHIMLMHIRSKVEALGGRFIEREGGLRRWHCQFRK